MQAPLTSRTALFERISSATVGSILTSLVVTPLGTVKRANCRDGLTRARAEVAKVRMQAQAHVASIDVPGVTALECDKCTHYVMDNGLMEHRFPKPLPCPDHPVRFRGTLHALSFVVRHEGFFSLYNGLQPTLWMAVPAQTVYFAVYDVWKDHLTSLGYSSTVLAPLLAGSGARVLAATVVAPLELLRTKAQAEVNPPSMLRMAARELQAAGPLSFWRGLSPTLLRDVPFSAIYWVTVESTRKRLNRPDAPVSTSALAGALGGLIAATLTHPFDVVKTRRQVFEFATPDSRPQPSETRTLRILQSIVRRDGVAGLFVGVVPRVSKIIPATAIMLSTYEFGKRFFRDKARAAQSTA